MDFYPNLGEPFSNSLGSGNWVCAPDKENMTLHVTIPAPIPTPP